MCFKRHHSVPIVLLTSPRGRIRHLVFIYSSHRDIHFQFTISQWLLRLRSVLSACHISINHLSWTGVTFFPVRNCYELPSSWSGVTSFPVKNLNCHISRTRHTRIPVFAFNWYLVTSILYIKKIARFHSQELCVFGPYLCRLIRPRRLDEGNCSYLLPFVQPWHSLVLVRSISSELWWPLNAHPNLNCS